MADNPIKPESDEHDVILRAQEIKVRKQSEFTAELNALLEERGYRLEVYCQMADKAVPLNQVINLPFMIQAVSK